MHRRSPLPVVPAVLLLASFALLVLRVTGANLLAVDDVFPDRASIGRSHAARRRAAHGPSCGPARR